MGRIAMVNGVPPSGSRQDPTTMPPSFSTRATTSRSAGAELSTLHPATSRPFDLGVALRNARFFRTVVFGGMPDSLLSKNVVWFRAMFLNIQPLRKHRDFRLLYTGQLVSMFGTMITFVAVPYQVFELTHSSFLVGMLGAVQLVPLLLFGLWGGAYADAIDRRKLLLISEIFLTLGSLTLALNSLSTAPKVWLIFVVGAAMAACN